MTFEPVGDSLIIVREFAGAAFELSRRISTMGFAGVVEAVPAYETVGVVIDPVGFAREEFESKVGGFEGGLGVKNGGLVEIPVWFEGGEDFPGVLGELGVGSEEFKAAFCEMELDCYAVGFSPGFPYLGYLPETLAGLERKGSPRARVPAGSVAMVGRQAGVYPTVSPGGWWLVGRTPVSLVDLDSREVRVEVGDRVRFVEISREEFEGYEKD